MSALPALPAAALALIGTTLLVAVIIIVALLGLGLPWPVLALIIATPALILSVA